LKESRVYFVEAHATCPERILSRLDEIRTTQEIVDLAGPLP
jgi:hypothetical protein